MAGGHEAEVSTHHCDAAAHSRSCEQGTHARAQGCATKSAGIADLNAEGGPECPRGASHRDVASSSRRRMIGKHQGQSSRYDVGETVMPGTVVLTIFAATKSGLLATDQIGRIVSLNAVGGPKGEPLGCGEQANETKTKCFVLAREAVDPGLHRDDDQKGRPLLCGRHALSARAARSRPSSINSDAR